MKTKTKFNILSFLLLILIFWWAISKLFVMTAALCVIFIGIYLMSSLTSQTFKRILRLIKSKLRRK